MIQSVTTNFSGKKRRSIPMRHNSRRFFIWCLPSFVLLQITFHWTALKHAPELKHLDYGSKQRRLEVLISNSPAKTPLVIAFGSSFSNMAYSATAMRTFRPTKPDGPLFFNFGMSSHGVVASRAFVNRVLNSGVRPDLVLVECTPHLLFRDNNILQQGYFIPVDQVEWQDIEILEKYHGWTWINSAHWLYFQTIPWLTYNLNVQNILTPEWVTPTSRFREWDAYGWEPRTRDLLFKAGRNYWEDVDFVRSAKKHALKMCGYPLSLDMIQAVEDTVADCTEAGIQVAVVRIPESSMVLESRTEVRNLQVHKFCDTLVQRYGAILIDARTWVPDNGFGDGCHVTYEGAKVFSARLDSEALAPILTRIKQKRD